MKTMKKLKLDTLSSNELANKEANQIIGGVTYCSCYCSCYSIDDRFLTRVDDRVFIREEPIP